MEQQEKMQDKWLKSVMQESFAEQKRTRRWGILFKGLTFGYLFIVFYLFLDAKPLSVDDKQEGPHTAMVQVKGVIAADETANANAIVAGLRAAFEHKNSKSVMMVINSPGGSPVQAGYIYDEMKRLRGLHPEKKLYAVIGELGASGGYYIAAGADEIFAHRSSLVGSIGVTASGFGFVDLLEKVGVERRHYTAGQHKSFLDPFSPQKEDESKFFQTVLTSTHNQFIKVVEEGRGDRIVRNTGELYSGLIWNGEQALELGLIDGFGSPGFVAREIINAEDIVDYSVRPSKLEAIIERLGVAIGQGVATKLQSSAGGLELK